MRNESGLHDVVTRPYYPGRFLDDAKTTEINVRWVVSDEEFFSLSFLENKKITPGLLTDNLYDLYAKNFGNLGERPDIFFHLIQKQSIEPLAPRVQIFTSDIVLGNLNTVGFYRTVVNGQRLDRSNSKKYIGEILRLYNRY